MSSIISSKIMDSSDATTITTTGDNSVEQKIRTSSFDSCLIIRDNSEKPDFLKVSLVIGANIKIIERFRETAVGYTGVKSEWIP